MANTYVYDPSKLLLTVGAANIDEFEEVKIEFDEDFVKTYTASNGSLIFTENKNRTGKITITLPQFSSVNGTLNSFVQNFSTISVTCTDDLGNSFSMAKAKCLKHPGTSYKKDDQSNRDWVFVGIINTVFESDSSPATID
jgi:hypothetical protein